MARKKKERQKMFKMNLRIVPKSVDNVKNG